MSKFVLVGYIVALHAALAFLLLQENVIERTMRRLAGHELPLCYKAFRLALKQQATSAPQGTALLLGDSLVQGLPHLTVAMPSLNLGISGDTISGVAARLGDYKQLESVALFFVSAGVNDLRKRTNEQILQDFRSVLSNLPPSAPALIHALLPVAPQYERSLGPNVLARISAINNQLKIMIRNYPHVSFADGATTLTDPITGALLRRYHVGDGIHLNSIGYAAWTGELRSLIKSAKNKRRVSPF